MVANFLSAHTHYTFSAQGRNFSVYAFKGREEIHKPFEFEIELVSRSANEDITALLGTLACLAITEMGAGLVSVIDTATGDATRYAHGMIRKMELLHTVHSF